MKKLWGVWSPRGNLWWMYDVAVCCVFTTRAEAARYIYNHNLGNLGCVVRSLVGDDGKRKPAKRKAAK